VAKALPRRGEIFLADLDPVMGHEQAGRRPFLVLSIGGMNRGSASLVIGVPLTSTEWTSPLHVRIDPAESGLSRVSYAMPEMVRSVSTLRFASWIGRVPPEISNTASARTGLLIGLGRKKL
jgi:mRNA interferase MazF